MTALQSTSYARKLRLRLVIFPKAGQLEKVRIKIQTWSWVTSNPVLFIQEFTGPCEVIRALNFAFLVLVMFGGSEKQNPEMFSDLIQCVTNKRNKRIPSNITNKKPREFWNFICLLTITVKSYPLASTLAILAKCQTQNTQLHSPSITSSRCCGYNLIEWLRPIKQYLTHKMVLEIPNLLNKHERKQRKKEQHLKKNLVAMESRALERK